MGSLKSSGVMVEKKNGGSFLSVRSDMAQLDMKYAHRIKTTSGAASASVCSAMLFVLISP